MLVIWQSLDLGLPDHQMFWVARSWGTSASCTCWSSRYLTYLATLHPSTGVSRTLQWIFHWPHCPCAYESRAPRRTRPGKAVFLHIVLGRHPLCAVHSLMAFLALSGMLLAPCFCLRMGSLSPALFSQIGSGRS